MKKSILFLNIFLFVNWTFGQFLNIEYHDVFSTGPDTAWVVGDAGAIIHTTDGGVTWNDHSYPPDLSFFSVCFADELNGFVIGGNSQWASDTSILIRTINGGATWNLVDLPGSSTLKRIHFVDEFHGWITTSFPSYNYYRTTDGGNTWDSFPYLTSLLYFIDPNIGWRVGQGLHKTIDGGLTWTNVGNAPCIPRDMQFIDEQHGIYVGNDMGGYGLSFKTIDGGVNWESLGLLVYNYNIDRRVNLAGLNNGWLGGTSGIVYSSDFFETWEVFETWPTSIVNSLSVHGYSNGWAVGRYYESNQGVIWKLNGYNDWVQMDIVSNTSLVSQVSELESSPNPFTDNLRISLRIDNPCKIAITVFNSMGQLVAVIEDRQFIPGIHRFSWNASGKPSGMYFLNLKVGEELATRKIVKF